MSDHRLHQVVVPPSQIDLKEEIIAAVQAAMSTEGYGKVPLSLRMKVFGGWLIHPLGFHFWVQWRQYDPNSKRLMIMGKVCRFCPKGRIGD